MNRKRTRSRCWGQASLIARSQPAVATTATATATAVGNAAGGDALDPRHDRDRHRHGPGRLLRLRLVEHAVQHLRAAPHDPRAARSPRATPPSRATYDDPQTITCTLREGLKFSNGNELTSSDVLFSFQRNIEIADPNGSSVLLGSISNGDEKSPGPGRRRDRDARRHDGRLPPQPARHDLPQGAVDRDHVDRRRGDVPGRQAARRRPGRRLRPVHAEPVQARRAGRARGEPRLRRRAHAAGSAGVREVLQRPGSAAAPPSRTARSTSPGARSARPT